MIQRLHPVLLIAFLSSATTALAQCPTGNVAFGSQSQIDGFAAAYPNCTELLGEVTIQGSSITNLQGLAQLELFTGGLGISNCPSLSSLNGLENVTTVDYLQVVNCDALTDLSGLDGLTTITGFVQIRLNALLANFHGLEAVQSIDEFVQIENNDALLNFTGLNSLTSIYSFVKVVDNPQLQSLDGLDALTSIAGYLSIGPNASLVDIEGLGSLNSISSFLQLSGNSSLTSLHGLEALDPTSFSLLTVINCPLLTECAIESICTYLDGTGQRAISGNATGCASVAEVQTACMAIGLDEHFATRVSLYPNPAHGEIRATGLVGSSPVEVRNAIGAIVLRSTLTSNGQLDLRGLHPGHYTLQWAEKGASLRLPFVVQ